MDAQTHLRIPPILPRNQSNQRPQHPSRVVFGIVQLQNPPHRLGREPDLQTLLVRLDGLVKVVQSFRQFTQDLPFRSGLLVLHRLLAELCHLRAPDRVDP